MANQNKPTSHLYSAEAEAAVIGGLLLYNTLFDEVISKINSVDLICSPKVGQHSQLIKEQIFMSKHYSIEFKHRIVKLILKEHWGIREAAEAFHMPSHTSIVKWLQRFEKYGINGLYRQPRISRMPRMLKRRPAINANNPQDIKALLKELEYLRAENAVLKKLKELDEQRHRKKEQ